MTFYRETLSQIPAFVEGDLTLNFYFLVIAVIRVSGSVLLMR